MKKLSRYGKQIMCFICTLVVIAGSVCSFSFESKASGDVFYLDYAEPATSEAQGYLVVAIQNNSTSEIDILTFFWNCYAINDGLESPAEMLLTITKTTVNFNVTQYDATGVWYTVGAITTAGNYRIYAHSNSSDYTYNFGTEGYTIVGWKLKGNGSVSGFWNSYDFSVFFSDDGESILLQEVIELLTRGNSIDSSILSTVQSILSSVDGVENQLSSIISYLSSADSKLTDIQTELQDIYDKVDELVREQQKSNSWLENIYDKICESLGLSPEESTEEVEGSDDIGQIQEDEDNLLEDTTEAESSLDITLGSGFDVLVSVFDRFISLDANIKAMFITVMTFGVMALILGR